MHLTKVYAAGDGTPDDTAVPKSITQLLLITQQIIVEVRGPREVPDLEQHHIRAMLATHPPPPTAASQDQLTVDPRRACSAVPQKTHEAQYRTAGKPLFHTPTRRKEVTQSYDDTVSKPLPAKSSMAACRCPRCIPALHIANPNWLSAVRITWIGGSSEPRFPSKRKPSDARGSNARVHLPPS